MLQYPNHKRRLTVFCTLECLQEESLIPISYSLWWKKTKNKVKIEPCAIILLNYILLGIRKKASLWSPQSLAVIADKSFISPQHVQYSLYLLIQVCIVAHADKGSLHSLWLVCLTGEKWFQAQFFLGQWRRKFPLFTHHWWLQYMSVL